MSRWLLLLLLTTSLAAQTSDPARFEFATRSLPNGMVGHPYTETIKLRNGAGPFQYRLIDGMLPPGLHLQVSSGIIDGTPIEVGNFRFSLAVRDLGTNEIARHTFLIAIQSQLLVQWQKSPSLNSNTLSGSVKITNESASGDTFEMTVIIVAVNEIGKAFALGYQRFDLAQNDGQVVPFSLALPNGRYMVRVDAIAALPNHQRSSVRSSLETPAPLVVNVNR